MCECTQEGLCGKPTVVVVLCTGRGSVVWAAVAAHQVKREKSEHQAVIRRVWDHKLHYIAVEIQHLGGRIEQA